MKSPDKKTCKHCLKEKSLLDFLSDGQELKVCLPCYEVKIENKKKKDRNEWTDIIIGNRYKYK